MLPEQRGLLTSFFNRFRSKRRSGCNTASSSKRRKQGFARLTQLESLEDRRMLTATLYVDFGQRLGNVSLPEDTVVDGAAGWSTLGLAITANNPVDWVFGPEFPYAGNPTITYTPLNIPQNLPTSVFDPGPDPAGSPIQFPIGPTLPLSVQAAVENSILEILAREVAPFDMNVELATSPNLAAARALLASNNRLTDPNQTLANPPNANLYNLTTANPKGFVPPGFDGTRLNTQAGFTYAALGSPVGTQDVYILVGGWTIGGQDVGGPTQTNSLGFSEPHGFTTTIDPNDPLFGATPGNPMAMPPVPPTQAIPITYSDAGVAVDAAQILQRALAGSLKLDTAISTIAAQMAAITYGGAYVFTDPTTMVQTEEILEHTNTGVASPANPFSDPDVSLLTSSDIMREGPAENGLPAPTLNNVSVFTRMPLMIGDGNQVPTFVQNAYDFFANDPDVGAQLGTDLNALSGFPFSKVAFVTGSGAFDDVSITNDLANPGMALVTVNAYRDATFSPNSFITTFSYDVDLTPGLLTTNVLLIELGNSNDQLDIDPSTANLAGTEILVFGGGGVDNMSLLDNGTDSISMAPENVDFFEYSQVERFETQLQISNGVIILADEFDDTSIFHLEGFNSLTYTMPEFLGDNFSLTAEAGSSLPLPPSNSSVDMLLDGTAGPTAASPLISVCNVEITDVPNVLIQDPIGSFADTFSITSDLGFSDGMQNIEINLGPGDDTLNLFGTDFAFQVPGGAFTYDGGLGTDTINAEGDTDWALSDTELTGAASGLDLICQNVENASITGGFSDNTLEVDSWAGQAKLDGMEGNDTIIIGDTVSSVVSGNITAFGGDGNDTFYVNSFVPGFDPITGTINTLTLSGDNGNDNFILGRDAISGAGDLNSITGNVNVTGVSGNDTLTLNDANSSAITVPNYTVGANFVTDDAGFGQANFDNTIKNLKIIGSTGANVFDVTPNRSTNINIDGNDPPFPQLPGTGDALVIEFSGVQGQQLTKDNPADGGGRWTFTSGQKPVVFSNIEDLQSFNPLQNVPLVATGAVAGSGSKPLVKVYNASNNALLFSFYAFESTFTGGARVTIANVFDSFGALSDVELIVAPGTGRVGEVKVYDGLKLLAAAPSNSTHLVANPDADLISDTSVASSSFSTVHSSKNASAAGLAIGDAVGGTNVAAGTTISAINAAGTGLTLFPKATVSATANVVVGDLVSATMTAGSQDVMVADTSSLSIGDAVFGANIPAGATIIAIPDLNDFLLSAPATGNSTNNVVIGSIVLSLKTTKNSTAATVSSVVSLGGLVVGQSIVGTDIPSDTTITAMKIGPAHTIAVTLSAVASSTGIFTASNAGFLPEGAAYKSGLYLATGDFNGDGAADIVTSRSTGVPMVRVFDGLTFTPMLSPGLGLPVAFNPYTSKFTTGAQIAVGDVDGDGMPDIVTAPGTSQSAQIKVFSFSTLEDDLDDRMTLAPVNSFQGFTSAFKGGVSLALGDINGDGVDEIMLGAGSGGGSKVQVFDNFGDLINQFATFTSGNINAPLSIATVNINGTDELFVGQGLVGKTHLVEGFNPLTGKLVDTFLEADPAMAAGVFLG
ncbi:MAG TPA: hypothetical protein VFE46_12165 [Pirellulales bacterium]|jgi:hypothetical protein|nr:hypothetical protein [Pirellulales bacterium]